MYKLIVCDADGTLLDGNFKISQIDKDAIKRAQDIGVKVSLCSGRSYKSLRNFAKELAINPKDNYIIGFNGGLVYDMQAEEVVHEVTLDKEAALDVIRCYLSFRLKSEVEIVVHVDGEKALIEKTSEYTLKYQATAKNECVEASDILAAVGNLNSISKIAFIGLNENLKLLERDLNLACIKDAAIFFTAEYLLEAGPTTCCKGDGLLWLCGKYGISPAETIAIGDNYNDLSMIEAAGLGVAVANAVEAVKDAADYATENDCKNGAVAEVINKFVL